MEANIKGLGEIAGARAILVRHAAESTDDLTKEPRSNGKIRATFGLWAVQAGTARPAARPLLGYVVPQAVLGLPGQ